MGDFDAIVLAGGTARRLGGVPKHTIEVDGRTLLQRALDAVAEAERIVVVGGDELRELVGEAMVVREDPPLAGPAAGIGAGLECVAAERVVVIACDHPFVADAIDPLLRETSGAGTIAVDGGGRRQNLLFAVRSDALREAVRRHHSLANLAVHDLLEPLHLAEVNVPPRALRDVDTWADLEEDLLDE
ncbi:MAG TPA: NTP transferase domain-containing protein [Aeromicrobium sp.]|nr:NTP transferase domain-containing protein [Aeromicrobium sp.]